MPNDITLTEIEIAFVAKLKAAKVAFAGKSIRRLDIGIFPWHGTIELSALCVGDACQLEDIAGWPHYNFSAVQEGGWPEAADVCARMEACWKRGVAANDFFELFGAAMNSQLVLAQLEEFNRTEDFGVTLMNPDAKNSRNYCV
ncbi:hypothetical protein ASD07_05605 [Duganella sp. Root336D2]|nr:hypothetical protein ASD07_05605 [Duganella sp. Root336D2]